MPRDTTSILSGDTVVALFDVERSTFTFGIARPCRAWRRPDDVDESRVKKNRMLRIIWTGYKFNMAVVLAFKDLRRQSSREQQSRRRTAKGSDSYLVSKSTTLFLLQQLHGCFVKRRTTLPMEDEDGDVPQRGRQESAAPTGPAMVRAARRVRRPFPLPVPPPYKLDDTTNNV